MGGADGVPVVPGVDGPPRDAHACSGVDGDTRADPGCDVPGAALLSIGVAFSPRAGEVDSVEMTLPAGASVADALQRSGLQARHPGVDLGVLAVGIWGARCERTDRLRDRDRVELYRPLQVDPKQARRLRVQRYRNGLPG